MKVNIKAWRWGLFGRATLVLDIDFEGSLEEYLKFIENIEVRLK